MNQNNNHSNPNVNPTDPKKERGSILKPALLALALLAVSISLTYAMVVTKASVAANAALASASAVPATGTPKDEFEFLVGDTSKSHSEKWEMTITGSKDGVARKVTMKKFGRTTTKSFKLSRDQDYAITMTWLDTKLKTPDCDWDAQVKWKKSGGASSGWQPGDPVLSTAAMQPQNVVTASGGKWTLVNDEGLLGTAISGEAHSTNRAAGKTAWLKLCTYTTNTTNCLSSGSVSLLAPTNSPVVCVGNPVTISAGVTNTYGQLQVVTSSGGVPFSSVTNPTTPSYGVTWTMSGVTANTNKGTGLTATFTNLSSGNGTVTFVVNWTNQTPCGGTGSSSVTNSFTSVAVKDISAQNRYGQAYQPVSDDGTNKTYRVCVAPANSPATNITVIAVPDPGMLDKFLPAGWQMTGGLTTTNADPNDVLISRTKRVVDITRPGSNVVTCVSGCSFKQVTIVAQQAALRIQTKYIMTNDDNNLTPLDLSLQFVAPTQMVTLAVSSGGGQIRVWSSQTCGPGALVLDSTIPNQHSTNWPASQMPTTLWIEGVDVSSSVGDVQLTLGIDTGCSWTTNLTVLGAQLGVDVDRNGNPSYDQTSDTDPFRFWINNNHDGYEAILNLNGFNMVQDDLGGNDDLSSTQITHTRDLEDYSLLGIQIFGPIQQQLIKGDIVVKLESDHTNIKVFPAAGGASLKYLTDAKTATKQITSPYNTSLGETANTVRLPSRLWKNSTTIYLLFAGISGNGEVKVGLYSYPGATQIGYGRSVRLNLKDVKDMYDTFTVASVPATTASGSSVYNSSSPETGQYILFVHGMGMDADSKLYFANTAYKRLWWQGYKGRFGAFNWPCLNFAGYDTSEYNAWLTAAALKNKLNDLNSSYSNNVYLFAHSQGNIVAGEAFRLGGTVNTYIGCQAAVPAHAYDPSTPCWDTTPARPDDYAFYPYVNALTQQTAGSYFNGVTTAGSRANFYNTHDWALDKWTLDQASKPDFGYYYSGGHYYRGLTRFTSTMLSYPADTYEIFSFGVESPSYALGATASVSGFAPQDVTALWPKDPFGKRYGEHCWHSGEFLFSTVEQWRWWTRLKLKFAL